MILIPHILVGAAIGAKTHNLGLIVILGLLSHFIMDKIPHWDYINSGIKDFRKSKNFKALFRDLFKIAVDGMIGLLIVFLIIWQIHQLTDLLFIMLAIFVSVLPDILLGLVHLFAPRNFAEKYVKFHFRFLHFAKDKEKEGKITFFNISTEILVIVIAIIILFS
ncbi:MAG: hypothetical protein COU82_00430 [Candidatus Portnoybacteria bacterium CG10_big_fil_rev_8_21_14_0_10_38_18]|uniref:DUF3307 domain-containing protein n=1 Tax=Candidatus Portnoybacteria bacterium CG10_big_fil_rev_8_21_14_0_10_38_18 TaxID=1974813 RepID=A0A2M8KCR6_9BACT|nr:MAG: hypothetical protein COU82_00430 [Candidatus Portnoybacteria bacterium CG10_big_fil_rev_8_21_14_0_10_38_18]